MELGITKICFCSPSKEFSSTHGEWNFSKGLQKWRSDLKDLNSISAALQINLAPCTGGRQILLQPQVWSCDIQDLSSFSPPCGVHLPSVCGKWTEVEKHIPKIPAPFRRPLEQLFLCKEGNWTWQAALLLCSFNNLGDHLTILTGNARMAFIEWSSHA